jgi:hypothetical protein
MSIKTVEAYCNGLLVTKRTILFGCAGPVASRADFIALAKESMEEAGVAHEVVDDWVVRDPIPGE